MINDFRGDYRFLSNFALVELNFEGQVYPSVEHAYQAAKTNSFSLRESIKNAKSPGEARKLGQKIILRPDWNNYRLYVMESLLRQKFNTDQFKTLLLKTGEEELIEGNTWGDIFWGVYQGRGQNMLGKLLMKIRQELLEEYADR